MTSNLILDGKACSQKLKHGLKDRLTAIQQQYPSLRRPGLAVIQVGDDPASSVYIKHKQNACHQVGIESFHYHFPKTMTEAKLLNFIDELNEDERVDAILCQLPLPKGFDVSKVTNHISPQKDADGFHFSNLGRSFSDLRGIQACTPRGIWHLLKTYDLPLSGKRAVILNRSLIVGKPLLPLLLEENMTVTLAHSKTENLPAICQEADLLVVAVGRPAFVPPAWVKPGSILVDVGINRTEAGLVGDIQPEAFLQAKAYTPVPGGVGPMTVACLMENTVKLYCQHLRLVE